jgi:hypothetical protein
LLKLRYSAALLLAVCVCSPLQQPSAGAQANATAPAPAAAPGVLDHDQASAILPATVFYRGQTASIQARNSAGIRRGDGRLILATLVDTSGYSSADQQTYQAYLITEVPLQLGAHTLPAGAYGFGFLSGDQMVVLDLGGHQLFRTATTHDAAMKRPRPLQIISGTSAASPYLLYLGRNFIALTPTKP